MKALFSLFLLLTPSMLRADGNLDEAIRFYEKGEFQKAATLLSELSRSSADDPKIRLWLGKSYIKIRQWDKAVREVEKATEIEPSNASYRLWLGRAWGYVADHTFKPFAAFKAKRVVKEFEEAAKLAPANLEIRFDLLEYYMQAPDILGGGDDRARAEVQEIAKLDPKKGPIARAMMYKKEKKLDLAKKELIQATIDFPDYQVGYLDLADFMLDHKDFEGALAYSQKAFGLQQSKRAMVLLAASQIRLRINLDEAERSLRELVSGSLSDKDPSFEEVYYWIGECHLAKGDKKKAREAFKSALAFDPEYGPAKKTMSTLR
jgi:tetratricopeptide (TPR) repeat protein